MPALSLSLSPRPESFYSDGLQLLWHSVGARDQNKNVYPVCFRGTMPSLQSVQPTDLKSGADLGNRQFKWDQMMTDRGRWTHPVDEGTLSYANWRWSSSAVGNLG